MLALTFTQSEQLVAALARLERRKRTVASVAELVVEVYIADRKRWGLRGYEAVYVDSNKVCAALSHKHGPCRRGYIERPFPGMAVVKLTEKGRELAGRLGTEDRKIA